jgi:hypothetical protein
MSRTDPKQRPRKEQDWTDRIPDAEEEPEDPEPTYRDGSAQNECWSEDGYTR